MTVGQPRIFVGTLACGEAEFEECCKAIQEQAGVVVTHQVIADKSEYEAHNLLWAAWEIARPMHDLFVKIDADTILNRPTALSEIYGLFRDNNRVTGAQVSLWDYFTDSAINGLNAFSPRVKFRKSKSRLFADHADYGHDIVLKHEATAHLAPIGWHAKYPYARQAFHYGFHRLLKGQNDTIAKLITAYQLKGEDGRAWAVAGAGCAKDLLTRWVRFLPMKHSFYERYFTLCSDEQYRNAMIRKMVP